jgi:hypothetical protein
MNYPHASDDSDSCTGGSHDFARSHRSRLGAAVARACDRPGGRRAVERRLHPPYIDTRSDNLSLPQRAAAPQPGARWAFAVALLTVLLPWPVRRWLLRRLCGYHMETGARIGLSLVAVPRLSMGAGARIGHFNMIKAVRLELGAHASIGHLNWIAGLPLDSTRHFHDQPDRDPALTLETHAAITSRHFIDCSHHVRIGAFSIVAGAWTQILTHAVDLRLNRQSSAPVHIGRYCFIGTGSVILKGSRLPDCSVLQANSTLASAFDQPYTLYSGVPAREARALPHDYAYFSRDRGFVE